MLGESI